MLNCMQYNALQQGCWLRHISIIPVTLQFIKVCKSSSSLKYLQLSTQLFTFFGLFGFKKLYFIYNKVHKVQANNKVQKVWSHNCAVVVDGRDVAGHAGGGGDQEVRRQGRPLVDAGHAASDAGRHDATVSTDSWQHQERYFASSCYSGRHRWDTINQSINQSFDMPLHPTFSGA